MKVAITGYYGTGSSAVLDLLSEYSCCSEGGLSSYEHVPLYFPDGLFDLEHKLLYGNDLHRSDEAIKSFRKAMYNLNDTDFGWYGSYKKLYGDKFKNIVDAFLESITQYTYEGVWYNYYRNSHFELKKFVKDCVKTFLPGKYIVGSFGRTMPELIEQTMELSFVSEEFFFKQSRKFIREYCEMINRDNAQILLLDHLMFPHNAYKIDRYFDDDFRLIIVERDIRDMFTLCKYVWPRMGIKAPYPVEPEAFLQLWTNMRAAERKTDNPHVLRIHFEDLIYKYDESVAKIESFLQMSPEQHVRKKTRFVPEKSINNTQNFRIQEEWDKEVKVFSGRTEDMYEFPYERKANIEDTFDN